MVTVSFCARQNPLPYRRPSSYGLVLETSAELPTLSPKENVFHQPFRSPYSQPSTLLPWAPCHLVSRRALVGPETPRQTTEVNPGVDSWTSRRGTIGFGPSVRRTPRRITLLVSPPNKWSVSLTPQNPTGTGPFGPPQHSERTQGTPSPRKVLRQKSLCLTPVQARTRPRSSGPGATSSHSHVFCKS